jgi:chromosome transmission fidelity protein 1
MNFRIDKFFNEIIEDSHAVLLTGGTMKPLGQ